MTARVARHVPFLLGLTLLLLVWSGLRRSAPVAEAAWQGLDLVVCLDVSRSMQARDVEPSRLERAKREIAALAAHAVGDRIGLVLFAGEARLRVPRTTDGASLAELARLAEPWDIPRGGTDLGAAVGVAARALQGRQGEGAIVILSDGGEPEDEPSEFDAATSSGFVIHALGFGSTRGAKIPTEDGSFVADAQGRDVVSALHPAAMRHLTKASGGSYDNLAAGSLVTLYDRAILPAARRVRATSQRDGDQGVSLMVLAALACLLFDFAWIARRSRRLPLGMLASLLLLVIPSCGGPAADDTEARAMFLKGNRAFADSVRLEAAGSGVDADPEALKAAYRRAEDALAAWQWAAATRMDWPEARRNVERGLLRLARLREHKRDDSKQKPPPKPPPPEVDDPEDPLPDSLTKVVSKELDPGGVLQILETLQVRERQKIDLRKARRTRRPAHGGRDW